MKAAFCIISSFGHINLKRKVEKETLTLSVQIVSRHVPLQYSKLVDI